MYCRYCHSQGHNKRGCPKLKEFVANNPTSYLADQLKRRCSYCSGEGHTRATCEKYKESLRQQRIEMLERRTDFCQKLANLGIMPGTLMRAEFYESSNRKWAYHPAIVKEIVWENIKMRVHNSIMTTSCITGETVGNNLPNEYGQYAVLSPMPVDKAYLYNKAEMEKTNEKALAAVSDKGKNTRRRRGS